MGKSSRLRKLARHLLATTCLTAAPAAFASTITEPPNFGTTFATATSLPSGTTLVAGVLNFGSDTNDFFTFQNLVPGTGFDFTASTTSNLALDVNIFDSSDSKLGGAFAFTSSSPALETITAPGDGKLIFDVVTGAEGNRVYFITVTTVTYAPEPGTLGAMGLGLGLVAGATLRLRRKKKI